MSEDLYFTYQLLCTYAGCGGSLRQEQGVSAGYTIGHMVPADSSLPAYGRCPKCKRHRMKVNSMPVPTPPPGPVGFTRVPTE